MGVLSRFFRRRPTLKEASPSGTISTLTQSHLNNLASILPITLNLIRVPRPDQNIKIKDVAEADVKLVRNLSDEQFKELIEVQEDFEQAQNDEEPTQKIKLYEAIAKKAPWHPFAIKSLGVCYFMAGDQAKAHYYLKQAAQLAPNDENIRANLQRIEADKNSDPAAKVIRQLGEIFGEFAIHSGSFLSINEASNFLSNLSFMKISGNEIISPMNMQINIINYEDATRLCIGGQLTEDQNFEVLNLARTVGVKFESMAPAKETSLVYREFIKAGLRMKEYASNDSSK